MIILYQGALLGPLGIGKDSLPTCILCLLTLQLKRNAVTIDGYTDVPPSDEGKLLQAVAAQPVSVGICGSERAFQLYSKVGPILNCSLMIPSHMKL